MELTQEAEGRMSSLIGFRVWLVGLVEREREREREWVRESHGREEAIGDSEGLQHVENQLWFINMFQAADACHANSQT